MPVTPGDDPRDQARQILAEGRREFARDVDAILAEVKVYSASLEHAIGEVGREEALKTLRRVVLEKFDERLPMRAAGLDPVVRQLLSEAYEAIEDMRSHRDTRIDLRDWLRAAAPWVT